MEHQFGCGFVTSITLIAMHFALPPQQAWHGAGDHVAGLVLRRSSGERKWRNSPPCCARK